MTPSVASVSRAALSWPCPPSISTRSGQGDIAVNIVGAHAGDGFDACVTAPPIAPADARFARMLGHQPLEPALQHFAHHAVIVAGRESVERILNLRYWFLRSLGAGDDHRADGVAALDVAVVVDLDAPRRARQTEGLGQRFQQFCCDDVSASLRPSASRALASA